MRGLYTAAGITAALAALVAFHVVSVDRADKAGFQRAIDQAKPDTTLVRLATEAADSAAVKTDTVIVRIRAQAARVDTQAIEAAALARQLPPDLAALPQVRALQAAVFTVETSMRALRDSLDARVASAVEAERQAHLTTRRVLTAQITEANLATEREHRARVEAEKRPGWGKVVGGTLVGASVGALSCLLFCR